MKYYKKQLKRIEATRKLLKGQRSLLRELILEGLTQVTFHTTTRTLTLPSDADTTYEATAAYTQFLDNRLDQLKQEAEQVKAQWELEMKLDDKEQETPANDSEIGASSVSNLSDN